MHATQPRHLIDTRTILLIPLMVLVFAAGALLGAALDVNLSGAQGQTLSIPAGDRSYDALEETRADRGLD